MFDLATLCFLGFRDYYLAVCDFVHQTQITGSDKVSF